MLPSEDLTALAQAQAALVRSLTVAAPVPDGFDPQFISLSARALIKKRVRTVARVWPQLVAALGDHYEERFQQYALKYPLPRHGGPLADGRFFARHLEESHELPDAGRWEAFTVDLHHVMRHDGLHQRRGLYCRAARFPQLRLLAFAIRFPGLGARLFTLPYGTAKSPHFSPRPGTPGRRVGVRGTEAVGDRHPSSTGATPSPPTPRPGVPGRGEPTL